MKASAIQAHEADFDKNHIDSDGKLFLAQPDTSFPFPLTFLTTQKSSGYYKAEEKSKSMVCLHYTCGYLKGDISTLTHPDYLVSVPFIVGRNGMVYQLFSSKFWSYHLGANAMGGNILNSQRSVAIEMSNIGPLTLDSTGQNLLTPYSDVYCSVSETIYYKKLPVPYRGYTYYSTFTDAQYTSLKALITFLCNKFSIPRSFLAEPVRYNLFDYATSQAWKGIASHVNFRPDGKTDIGPAFDWGKIIQL